MQYLDHERLDVYHAAVELVLLAEEVVERLPQGRGYLADQLRRASTSVPLNIAEGAGEYAIAEKGRFYRMAKRSAMECASIIEICRRLRLIEEKQHGKLRETLIRIAAMLTKMAQGASVPVPVVPVDVPMPLPSSRTPQGE